MTSRKRRRRMHPPPGASPGTILVEPGAPHPIITVMAYGEDELRELPGTDVATARAQRGALPVTWVDVEALGDAATITQLGEAFGLHRLALEDVVSGQQRPKAEEYGDHLFVVARMALLQPGLEMEQVSFFLGRDVLVTFQERPGDCFEPVRQRIRKAKGSLRARGPDYLFYALLDAVVDNYFPVIDAYGERLEAIEEELLGEPARDCARRIQAIRHEVLVLRRAMWPLRDTLAALLREESPLLNPETRVFLRDCHDHAVQIMDLLETYRELVSGLMDVYLSAASTRLNEVMKVLTVIATIFMPLSFIASLYGMNFDRASPWNMPELGWRFGYPFALGLMAAVTVGLVVYFARKRWL